MLRMDITCFPKQFFPKNWRKNWMVWTLKDLARRRSELLERLGC